MKKWWARNSWWFVVAGGFSFIIWFAIAQEKIFANKVLLLSAMIPYAIVVISAVVIEYTYYRHKPVFWWLERKK